MSPATCQERFASLRDGLRPHLTEPVRRPGRRLRPEQQDRQTPILVALSHQKGTHLQGGAAAPQPRRMGCQPPLFQPLTAYTARGRIFPAPARGTRTPNTSRSRPGVPHTCHTPECLPVIHGHLRALTPPFTWSAIAAAHTADRATDLPSWDSRVVSVFLGGTDEPYELPAEVCG
jgi:hypothetical protein